MISLTREVRFSLNPNASDGTVTNSWGGWPTASTIAPWMVFRCTLSGEIEPISGYLCNIKQVDDVLRQKVIGPACGFFQKMTPESLLKFAFEQIKDEFPNHCRVQQLQLFATPTLEYTLHSKDLTMIQLTQQFEFSASHRLHNPNLSREENLKLFGKCNNPHGHGHNYVVSITIAGDPGTTGTLVPIERFEDSVKRHAIDRLDHRYLNVELDEFKDLNPTVENIAIVVWKLLEQPISRLGDGLARLDRVRVYETPKTWADYCGNGV